MNPRIYVVVGRSGLIFTVTTDFDHSIKIHETIEGSVIHEWLDGRHIFTYK